jgi:hypothetical protein
LQTSASPVLGLTASNKGSCSTVRLLPTCVRAELGVASLRRKCRATKIARSKLNRATRPFDRAIDRAPAFIAAQEMLRQFPTHVVNDLATALLTTPRSMPLTNGPRHGTVGAALSNNDVTPIISANSIDRLQGRHLSAATCALHVTDKMVGCDYTPIYPLRPLCCCSWLRLLAGGRGQPAS